MKSPNAIQRSNSKSNKNKSPLLMCFKPATIDDKDGVVLSPEEDDGESHQKRKGGSKWQALRAAFKGTSSLKKISNIRKANKDKMPRSNSTLEDSNISTLKLIKTTHRTTSNASSTFGHSSPAFTSSSSITSTGSFTLHADYLTSMSSPHGTHSPRSPLSPSNRNGVIKHRQVYIDYRREWCYYGTYTATCMLLIGLLFLVMWGKCLAIVYTSIWFYMVRPVRERPCNFKYGLQSRDYSEFDSVQYRRKIIMEGLLERSHSNVSLASCSMHRPMSLASNSMQKSYREKNHFMEEENHFSL